MPTIHSRRGFLNGIATAAVLAPLGAAVQLKAQNRNGVPPAEITRPEPKRPAPLDKDQVREFVGVCHTDIDRVSALLAEQPKLVYASWDWGGGDWEMGLGAASHVGQRDIARLLLKNGARKDIFAAAMLGERDVVKAMISADANMANQVGPHGYRVLYHAAISGDVEMAEAVLSKIEKKQPHLNQALSAALRDGHYEMTRWLLENGSKSVNQPSAIGEKPLRTATRRGDKKIIELLLQYGATDDS
jgi:hypothetical protein